MLSKIRGENNGVKLVSQLNGFFLGRLRSSHGHLYNFLWEVCLLAVGRWQHVDGNDAMRASLEQCWVSVLKYLDAAMCGVIVLISYG
jgi:hypothetical protein